MKTSKKRMLLLLSIMILVLAFPAAASAKTSISKKKATLEIGQTTSLKIIGSKKYTCKVTVKENVASSSKKWSLADVNTLNEYLINASDAVESAKNRCKNQSSYDYYISKAITWLNLAHDLALDREWGDICDNEGITIGANIDGLLHLANQCKSFKSIDSVIGGRVFYGVPLDATKLSAKIAKTRNAVARYALEHFF